MYTRNKKSLKDTRKYLIVFIAAFLLAAGVYGISIYKNRQDSKLTKGPYSSGTDRAKTTSKLPTAQPEYTQGSEKGSNVPSSTSTTAALSDNNGTISNVTPASTWKKSADNVITSYSPATNELIRSGASLTGSSTVDSLGFRLIDDVSGVIAQGTIKVIDGKFSGTLTFATPAKEGRIDLFQQSATGIESSNLSVPVRFQ